MEGKARTQRLLIRKRERVWKVLLVVKVAGAWLPYAFGGVATFADVPDEAAAVWALRPNHRET